MQRPRGPLTVLLLRLGVVAVLYSALRVLFLLLNRGAFPDPSLVNFIGGIRFDLSAIGWLNLPWVVLYLVHPLPGRGFGRVQTALFLVLNAIGFFFNAVDIEYYKFTLRRSTADLFGIMSGGSDLLRLAPEFLVDFWYIAVAFGVCMVFAWWGYRWAGRFAERPARHMGWRIGWRTIALVVLVLFSRGGVQLIPLGILNAGDYARPRYFPLVLNTPFTIMTSLGKPVVEERRYMPQEEADRLWPVEHHFTDRRNTPPDLRNAPTPPNVVVIMLESFSAEYSAHLAGGEGHMPFLDSLMRNGICFTRAYANGRRSIDAVPAVVASIPELMDEAFLSSPYAETPFTSLPSVLDDRGYASLFLHGGNNGTMSFDVFARTAGFQHYLGRNEYTGDKADAGVWGVRDRPYLRYCADRLSRTRQPFLATIFTLSSHHPYRLPEDEAARFGPGTTQPLHATLRYADDALRGFFAASAREPWFANTLFVVTADHTADLLQDNKINSTARDYWVPLVYYMPAHLPPTRVERVTQHIDILPTVLDLIGYEEPFFSFGQSALREDAPAYGVTARDHLYLLFSEYEELVFDGERPLIHRPIERPPPPSDTLNGSGREAEMQRTIEAIVQQFTTRLVERRLTIEPILP